MQTIDIIRLILICTLYSSVFFIIVSFIFILKHRKCSNIENFSWKYFLKVCIVTLFQIKNLLILLSLIFYIISFVRNFQDSVTESMIFNEEFDFNRYAYSQRVSEKWGLLSFFFVMIYSLKYLQLFSSLNNILKAFKKATFEYFSLFFITLVIFLGLSILTTYVYGGSIFNYRNLQESILTNIKIFILVENTLLTNKFFENYRVFSIVVLLCFSIFIRYILLNMFFPIIIEYHRLECEGYYEEDDLSSLEKEKMTFYDSKYI